MGLDLKPGPYDARMRHRWPYAPTRPRSHATAWLAIAVIVLGLVSVVAGAIDPPRAEAVGGPTPDIVLVITDDQRADTLTYMPQLRRRVSSRGLRFRSAYIPNPSCCPSRASFLTGTYSHTNGVWKNGGPFGGFGAFDDVSTIATWLDAAGYRTGLFGKYLNGYTDPSIVPPGWDEWFGFISGDGRNYYGFDVSVNGEGVDVPGSVYSTVATYERVSGFIRSTPDGEPLFAMWTPIAPHRPSLPEARYADARIELEAWRPPNYNEHDVSDKASWLQRTDRLDAPQRETIDEARIGQYRTLLSVDDGMAEIVKALRQTGRLENTLIVFASDNGLMWGEHRLSHKAAPYAGASRVPMIVRYDPLVDRSGRSGSVGSLVLNIDIAPTIVELAGLSVSTPLDGRSLVPVLDGSSSTVRSRAVIEHAEGGVPAYCGARTRHELFVHYTGGDEEYYRLDVDPWNLENVVDDPRWRGDVEELRRYTKSTCTPRPPGFSW